ISHFEKILAGFNLASFGTYLQIGVNRPQIGYYFFLIAAGLLLLMVVWIKQKTGNTDPLAIIVTAIAAIVGGCRKCFNTLTYKMNIPNWPCGAEKMLRCEEIK
ncbi:MAG: hypothetical protein IPO53_14695, partial [Chitinophagaceae bacterium]|nr:hypothetical protein [Chitinophagaceae bacterium]